MSTYERRSKTHLFLVSDRISKADFECALTAVAKGSRRSCERSAQVMLVTWPRCKNNCSSDFRLLFPGLGKSKFLDHFAFSQPEKKQTESLDHFAFSRAGKKQIGSLTEQTGLTEPSLVHGGLRPTKNTPA